MQPRRDQAGEMRHVDQKQRADAIGNLRGIVESPACADKRCRRR